MGLTTADVCEVDSLASKSTSTYFIPSPERGLDNMGNEHQKQNLSSYLVLFFCSFSISRFKKRNASEGLFIGTQN